MEYVKVSKVDGPPPVEGVNGLMSDAKEAKIAFDKQQDNFLKDLFKPDGKQKTA